MKAMILALGLMIHAAVVVGAETSAPDSSPIYDSDPKHLWNRLNDSLFVRTANDGTRYGVGQSDILFWSNTRHLLVEPSHKEAIRTLDDFISEPGERLISDPLKRALLQRDLWQLFDWTASPWTPGTHFANERAELQTRLVTVIQRLALSAKEIAALPDNYARAEASEGMADLPRGLFERDGNWLSVGAKRNEPTAATHTIDFGGRSIFLVMVRFPQGRQQAISYLQQLPEILPIKALPQFPINTEWALVRRLCVIDEHGEIQPTALVESIQLRRYVSVQRWTRPERGQASAIGAQHFAKFDMDRRDGAALKAIVPGDKDFHFVHFRSLGIDAFEYTSDREPRQDPAGFRTETLRTCANCHQAPGMHSVHSYNRFGFSTPPVQPLESSSVDEESAVGQQWKRRQFDWGLLQGLWRQVPRIN